MIAQKILEAFPMLADNKAQQQIVGHADGPLLVIAGPGSGKTFSLVLRALNLFLLGKATPQEVVLCTFTEKAAFEMRDRLSAAARMVQFELDLSELSISTIHSLCNKILSDHRHRTALGHGFETLDDLSQLLFIFEHFDDIIGEPVNNAYLAKWSTKWTAIEGARNYFNKATEECIQSEQLTSSRDPFLRALGSAYQRYEQYLLANNRIDFSHLQSFVCDLLDEPAIAETIRANYKYVMVDEYQDTNFIQEKLLLGLAQQCQNICVVGDEDQSLYRFRGATVRNILEFPQRVAECQIVQLTTNYRSHADIVARYDNWMRSANWGNPNGPDFRFEKRISPHNPDSHEPYAAVFSIWGQNARDEADRFADMVEFLKTNDVIDDYSQVALLLHSVRDNHSGPYLHALDAKGISAYCPRARAYFEIPEIRQLVACYAVILGWFGDGRGQVSGPTAELANYVDAGIVELGRNYPAPHPLAMQLSKWTTEITRLSEKQALDMRPADYLYYLLAVEPFRLAIWNENTARNLAIFSQLLNTFQAYYHYSVITGKNRGYLRLHFFNSFLRLLFEGGMNEYEDRDQPFPKGHVQVMTIHQAKGLEFPVVAVGSLSSRISSQKQIDRDLGGFYSRPPFEPEARITEFDRMRLHYVAFSRPEKVLVLTAHEQPKNHFGPIWQGLPQWPYVQTEILAAQRFEMRERLPVKKSYSFTGDLKVFETCPRQYQFFRDYDFTPSRSAVIFFGLLVHQSIEEIHRIAMDGDIGCVTNEKIADIFERTFRFLCLSDVRPIGQTAKEAALRQVLNYFQQNQEEMKRIVQTEVDVSLEKDSYILVGKVDLLLGGDGKLELLDFKTSPRPKGDPELLDAYERQLCTYAHILERRHGKRVDRLMLYWTSEERKEDALMVLPYDPRKVDEAGKHFDQTVRKIQNREFDVKKRPDPTICKECDLRILCGSEGVIAKEVIK